VQADAVGQRDLPGGPAGARAAVQGQVVDEGPARAVEQGQGDGPAVAAGQRGRRVQGEVEAGGGGGDRGGAEADAAAAAVVALLAVNGDGLRQHDVAAAGDAEVAGVEQVVVQADVPGQGDLPGGPAGA